MKRCKFDKLEKPIFMSLGSQYTWEVALKAIDPFGHSQSQAKLKHQLEKQFSGQALLTYKGRDALQLLLENIKITPQNHNRNFVFMQGFACFAIEEAIVKAGLKPGFVDTDVDSVNLSLKQILKARERYGLPIAIVLQHTFGVPVEVESIYKWCQENQVILIDDLAQSFGAQDELGKLLGSNADGIICSFGRDKVVDGVTGGAFIIKNQQYFNLPEENKIFRPHHNFWASFTDSIYPLLTKLIRTTFSWHLGRGLHAVSKKLKLMRTPLFSYYQVPTSLPKNMASMALESLKNIDATARHRRQIASIYFAELSEVKTKELKVLITDWQVKNGANLRFPLWVEKPEKLIAYLTKYQVYISDRWYRQVIDCSSLKCRSLYKQDACPNAQALTSGALQLPTHQEVSEAKARKIVKLIKEFYGQA